MNRQAISTTARALQLGVYHSLSTSAASRAAIATAASPSTSTSSEMTPPSETPSSSGAKRTSTRRMAVPASSSRAGTAKSASTSASISSAAVKARNARVAPNKAVKVDVYADAGSGMDDAEIEAMGAEDHTMQNFGGIDDYAHLAPPSQPRPVSAGTSAAARAPRRAVAPRPAPGSYQGDQPTPSPPMTSLPSGPSTLPMIGGHAGMPIPATLLAAESAGSDMARQPDISGEVSAPAGSDWTTSFYGLSQQPFSKEVAEALLKPLEPEDVELKPGMLPILQCLTKKIREFAKLTGPDGLLYLPEIKYRRTLNAAFGPGGWGLAPRGETNVGPRIVSREWGLVCLGRYVRCYATLLVHVLRAFLTGRHS